MASTDPNGADAPADKAAETAKAVADAIDVPLCVWGSSNVANFPMPIYTPGGSPGGDSGGGPKG